MLDKFRAYQTSLSFYRSCEQLQCARHLQDPLFRAAGSISLNLSEGSAQRTAPNRLRFYHMAFGSIRECQTILDLAMVEPDSEMRRLADQLATQTYCLCRPRTKT